MTKTTFLVLAALAGGLAAPFAIAQEKDTPASLMVELEQALPRKSPAPGAQVPLGSSIDWEKSITQAGDILARSAGTKVEPHALYVLASALYGADRIEEARVTFEDLKSRFPNHPLVKTTLDPETKSLVDQALDDCVDELAFRQKHKIQMLPRPEIDPKLLVTFHLSVGKVKIRFYKNAAPQHRQNFLKLAREGAYDRTRIHRVVPGILVHMGDPNSREINPDNWGKGDPGYALDNEFSLATHKAGTVTMWRGPGKPKSHGCQFQILLQDQPHLDFVQTPFAEVVEGLDILDRVSRQTRNQYEAPVEDVFVNGITIEEQ